MVLMSRRDHDHMRQRLAQQAAQILVDSGSRDFHAAKQKAAQQLGAFDTKSLPSNKEIEAALIEYQRLFHSNTQPEDLYRLRTIALEAMKFLQDFKPKIVGGVLSGTADKHSSVRLHLFADTVESVGLFLMDKQIPNQLGERRIKVAADKFVSMPTYMFLVDETPVELMVFLPKQHQVPLSPVDGKPMRRANRDELELLLSQSG